MPTILLAISAAIIFALGAAHLVYTFVGNRFYPRDPNLLHQLQNTAPVLTRQTTMWRAWIGFNASHSLGAMFFGLVYGYLAVVHPTFIFSSAFLQVLGLATLGSYIVLARLYWFKIPFRGIAVATVLYAVAVFLARTYRE